MTQEWVDNFNNRLERGAKRYSLDQMKVMYEELPSLRRGELFDLIRFINQLRSGR